MRIREVEVNENYPIRRFQSEGGLWEWGIRPMLFGYRVTRRDNGAGIKSAFPEAKD